jgi:CheY-like chemotaxis protein
VHGDRLRLEQVASNLLTNAIKYTPRGGSVKVTLRRSKSRETDCFELHVADTGVGIAADALERIFDLFAQADRSLDRSQGGLGLGLTVVQGLVGLHGGRVEARSEGLCRGSELIVTLPTADARPQDAARVSTRPPPAPPAPPPPEPSSVDVVVQAQETSEDEVGGAGSRRVVIVDDNDDLREMLEMLLSSAGHDVTTAADGPSGLDRILERRPDAAFVDLGLPGFDGYELARRVRAGERDTLLVAVSGYAQPEDRRRALDAGFDDHLKKPVGFEQLARVLRQCSRVQREMRATTPPTSTAAMLATKPEHSQTSRPH